MSQDRYDVVFYGDLVEGASIETVKQGFIKLFSLTEERVEQMFAVRKVTIKPDLDQQTAEKYQLAMERIGAKASLESKQDEDLIADLAFQEAVVEEAKDDVATAATELASAPAVNENSIRFKIQRWFGIA